MFRVLIILMLSASYVFSANPMRPDNMAPTAPVSNRTEKPIVRVVAPPKLENIIIIGQYKSAVFRGNKTIELGDWINGYRLTDVTPNFVVLTKGQKKEQIYLKAIGEVKISPAKEELAP